MTKGRHVVMSCCCWCCDNLGSAGSSSAGAGGVVTGASGGSVVVGTNANNAGGSGLGIASGLSAMLSLVVVTVAISTGEWLLTEEKLPKTSSNASVEPDSKVTYSGLWRVCVAISSRMEYECSSIDYFPNEEYSPDPSDSTMAIPYAVTKSAMFFFAATSLLVVAEVCYFTAHVTHPRHRLCVFVAGVVFIVSGLLMLVGMVMYISVFKAEVGSKLRPRSSFQGPPFTYRYGFSFLLYVSGFITTEVAGTYAIFLYISWHQKELLRRDSRRKNYGGVYHLDNHHVHHANHATIGHSGFLCERHQKRYFFGRDSVDHVDFDEFLPPPPNLEYHDHFSRQFPRDLTTQTVSTTADVLQEEEEEYSPSVQHEFVTFDLDEPLPPPPPVRGGEWTFDTLRKTTPV
ncbi:voltage-dependent calcium channel gamma-7 subunit isoform X1 [Bombus affinis]|uniref:Voltage-dependent calcium channel gamma-7 subunit isoform X1 n=2 Tax=Bombus TaxID=28641 RepID=A0A9B0C1C5_BOMTE|nr:voltage-dependent calcium channel gamma-7 subunit isoform X1 [Bombus terrestris]XP_003491183.1 voltage-dependent calcium channel gamma-7 subunit [Bombus impatiens]XP_043599306.1 voltage-dependent calcium channel gamma-7 subunit isoform X1 [Bombus pyrosoma]XP_050592060.1 voltage-dependent calcium channel gamma-7 subunit isoform X1 [Bombus affinis]